MGFLGRINLHNLGLLFPEQTLKVTSISTSLVGTVISQLEFLGNVLVISGDKSKFLLNLDLVLAKVVIGRCEFSDLLVESTHLAFVILNNLDGVVIVNSQALEFQFNGGESLDGNVILLEGSSQLLVDIIISSRQFHDLLGLDLCCVLELRVGLVGSIKGHFEFGNGDCHLLLNSFNFDLKSVFRVSQFAGKNVDLFTELLLEFSLHLGQFLFKNSNTIVSLLFAGISILVSTGKFLTSMSKFAVVTIHISHAFLESIKFQLQRLNFISKNSPVTAAGFEGHLLTVHLISKLDNLSSAELAVLVGLLIQIGHLLKLGREINVELLR